MDAGQVEILAAAAQKVRLHGGEALQRAIHKSAVHHAPCGQCILQAGNQRPIVRFGPVINERVVPDDPFAIFPPPALSHDLTPDETAKELPAQLVRAEGSVLHHANHLKIIFAIIANPPPAIKRRTKEDK